MANETKKLYRSKTDKIIAGVCGGIGDYFNIDPVLIRILFVLLAFADGLGVLLYIILAIVVPRESGKKNDNEEKIKEFSKKAEEKIQEIAGEFKEGVEEANKKWQEDKAAQGRNVLGLLVVLIGVMAFFNQFFSLSFFKWNIFWPILIIIVGILIIARGFSK